MHLGRRRRAPCPRLPRRCCRLVGTLPCVRRGAAPLEGAEGLRAAVLCMPTCWSKRELFEAVDARRSSQRPRRETCGPMPGSVVAPLRRAGLFGHSCGGGVVRFDDGVAVVPLDRALDLDDLVG